MMNSTTLVGRLTKDPELKYTPSGVAVATFVLAVNRTFTNQQGEREADFINCVVWNKKAENVANFLRKGSLTGVEGRLQTRNYEGSDGKRQYVTEVVAREVSFLEPKGNSTPTTSGNAQNNSTQTQNTQNMSPSEDPFTNNGQPIDISDDDLPF